MPNWFYFTVEVNGKKEDVKEFIDGVQGSERHGTENSMFDFNNFIPQPKNLYKENIGRDKKEELNAQGIPNWYDWNIDNWGTKWNARCEDRDIVHSVADGIDSVRYELETAWSFPSPVIEKMLEKYPHLSFEIEGEEESQEYGVYIKHDNGDTESWCEEEPTYYNEENGRDVYWDSESDSHKYTDNNEDVDPNEFYTSTKYSWS